MLKYIVRRVFIFVPTLFAISLIAFVISTNAPGDPIELLVHSAQSGNDATSALNDALIKEKDSLRHKLGLDLPVFYFSLSNCASPDTLYRVYDKNKHSCLDRLISIYGDWDQISDWYHVVQKMDVAVKKIQPDSAVYKIVGDSLANNLLSEVKDEIFALYVSYDEVVIDQKLQKLDEYSRVFLKAGAPDLFAPLSPLISKARFAFREMKSKACKWKTWIPTLKFYGYNQYHRWLFGDGNWLTGNDAKNTKGVIRGDFGISYSTQRPVSLTIGRAIPWSLLFTLLSVFLAYLISIPVGVKAAANRGGLFDRASSVTLFMLYSLPNFFLGTLLLMTFANPSVFNWFPANGVKPATGYPDGISLFEKIKISIPYLILPLICYTYSSLAFLSRTMRVAMLEVIGQDYIRTAKAKGLSYYLVIYKHGLRNALLPIITVFANIFPLAVGGSVILEFLFGIPGMGQEILQAVYTKDYPMIVCVFTLSGLMTLIGYLVADILYAIADPRISYSKK